MQSWSLIKYVRQSDWPEVNEQRNVRAGAMHLKQTHLLNVICEGGRRMWSSATGWGSGPHDGDVNPHRSKPKTCHPPFAEKTRSRQSMMCSAMHDTSSRGVSSACLLVNNDGKGVVFSLKDVLKVSNKY